MVNFIKKHPYLCSAILSLLLGMGLSIGADILRMYKYSIYYDQELMPDDILRELLASWMGGGIIGAFVIYPAMLTLINIAALFTFRSVGVWKKTAKGFEIITLFLGTLYSLLVQIFMNIQYQADWQETLINNQTHTPINTETYPTVIFLGAVGVVGYFILSMAPLQQLSPLVIVGCISAMYIGILESMIWIAQMMNGTGVILCVFPANCIIIAVKTILVKIQEWNLLEHEERVYKNKLLQWCSSYLNRSEHWPLAAFLLMWPLLGICICILTLFGQRPDSVIRAWTETSDWNLSRRVAPQNIYYDEHYLCTVAAGGHEKVVKPLRLGVRHGHEVIVNRQLCVANAFEQILEEKTPVMHRHIRRFYDTYGFPVARMIHSPYAADLVYFLMKPLEWMFLIVLYFCDVNPENRIAVQYLPKMSEPGKEK